MHDAFRVSYGPVAPFSLVACGVISILVALQPRSIEVLTPVANNSYCAAIESKPRKTQVLQLLDHLDAAYNLARWLTHNEHDAEDIVQDAYLRAIPALRRLSRGRRQGLGVEDCTQSVLRLDEAKGYPSSRLSDRQRASDLYAEWRASQPVARGQS
jgi:sigma-70-like protein